MDGNQDTIMTKRNSYIAAAAVAIAGTIGMASWLSISANDFERDAREAALIADARPGVAETEAALLAQAPASELAPTTPLLPAPAPVYAEPAPVYTEPANPVAAPRRAARAANTTRTPVAAPETRTLDPGTPEPRTEEPRTEPVEPMERVEPMEPAAPRFRELQIPAGTILGVRLITAVSSETAEIEDRVEATVTRDVIADGRVAIPAGTKVLGSVNEVTRGGKFKERARLGVRFHTLVLADGARETVRVDAIVREGDSPARESAAKIGGGAVGGAIIGGIMGGRKGAILGGVAGAGAGSAAVAAGDRSVAVLTAGSPLSVRLDAPVSVTIERN